MMGSVHLGAGASFRNVGLFSWQRWRPLRALSAPSGTRQRSPRSSLVLGWPLSSSGARLILNGQGSLFFWGMELS